MVVGRRSFPIGAFCNFSGVNSLLNLWGVAKRTLTIQCFGGPLFGSKLRLHESFVFGQYLSWDKKGENRPCLTYPRGLNPIGITLKIGKIGDPQPPLRICGCLLEVNKNILGCADRDEHSWAVNDHFPDPKWWAKVRNKVGVEHQPALHVFTHILCVCSQLIGNFLTFDCRKDVSIVIEQLADIAKTVSHCCWIKNLIFGENSRSRWWFLQHFLNLYP